MRTPSYEDYLCRRYFRGLDGLRCLAIIAVVWHHVPKPFTVNLAGRGFLGVDLFFVISGFLITTLLIREKRQAGCISLTRFWLRRMLRLMPAYYGLLLAITVVYLQIKPDAPNTAKLVHGLPVYVLYLSNWFNPGAHFLGPTWSLATEEQFYLVWPIIEAFATPFLTGLLWGAALMVNQLINFGVFDGALGASAGLPSVRHSEILQVTFTPILIGVALAHLLERARSYETVRKIAGFRHATLTLGFAIFFLLWAAPGDISGLPRLTFHIAFALLLASIILAPESAMTGALETRPIAFIGTISYGVYLYHLIAIHFVREAVQRLALPEFPTVFIGGLALSIAVATISYYFYEKRFLDLRERYRLKGAAHNSGPTAPNR